MSKKIYVECPNCGNDVSVDLVEHDKQVRADVFKEIAYSDNVKKEEFEILAYNKGRADAIDEYFNKFDNWIKSNSKLSYFWTEFEVEARRIAKELKGQNK